jgi:serine/threonine protein kinase
MIANKYTIEREIQRGAFGVILKGIYEKRSESVAIKIEHGTIQSLKHEVKMCNYLFMAGVRKIPSIYWFGSYLEKPCLVMTFYECSLYDYCISKKENTFEKMNILMFKIIEIFENIHKHFVLHRDIKPQNFMIKDGDIYLIDFGLATFYINENGEHYPDEIGDTMIGSPKFASTHIHEGHRYSRRDDMISIGYIYLFMMGISFEIDTCFTECSQLPKINIHHPFNLHLKNKKQYDSISPYLIHPIIQYYIEYTYALAYIETPKYIPLKQLFAPK